MATKILTPGYTWYATLDGSALSITSFGMDVTRNLIKSNAPNGFNTTHKNIKLFQKHVSQILPDWVDVKVSLSAQATEALIGKLFTHIATKRNTAMKVYAKDVASGTVFDFQECYLTSFGFDISEGGVLVVNLEFFVVFDYTDSSNTFSFSAYSDGGVKENHSPFSSTVKMIPFTNCSIEGQGDLISINFSFTQEITPKFGMQGNSSTVPLQPYKLLFGLPTMTLGYTQMTQSGVSISTYNMLTEYHKDLASTGHSKTIICGTKKLVCYDCVLEDFTPTIADKSSYTIVEYNYSVVGKLNAI